MYGMKPNFIKLQLLENLYKTDTNDKNKVVVETDFIGAAAETYFHA